jgi:hypothetical protein
MDLRRVIIGSEQDSMGGETEKSLGQFFFDLQWFPMDVQPKKPGSES